MHTKAVSWDHTPSIVPDRTLFSFSTSNFHEVPARTTLKPALRPPRKQDNPKTSTSLLSNLFSPSVSKEAPPSMKPNLPKETSRYNHSDTTFQSKLGHGNAISHTLYDDPAFSSDPHANPFFVTGHDGQIPPPMPGHPTLKKDAHKRPTLPLTIPPIVRDSGSFRLIQPPNSPMSIDDHTTTSFHDSTQSQHKDKPSKLTKASTAAAKSPSAPKSSVPAKSEEQSRPLEKPERAEKKRNPLGMFWRKSPPTSPTDKSAVAGESKQSGGNAPLSYETIFSHPPASVAVASETQQSFDIASLSSWSSPAFADIPPYPGPLHPALGKSSLRPGPRHPAVAKHRKRKNKLDRIDELDESNPLGIAVHHGGPYEAIQRLVQKAEHSRRKVPHNVGSQYATPTSSQNSAYNVHGSSLGTYTPSSVSLNLTPGQILPRGPDDYYNPYLGIKAPPVPHPQSNNRHRIYPAHMLSSQEPWDAPQQHRQEQVPRVSTSTQYPRPPQPSRPNETAAQQFSPRPVESVPQTPRQTLPRDLDSPYNPYLQLNGGTSTPRPSDGQLPYPSQKSNSQGRWAPQRQDRQDQIPHASAFAQHLPRRNDMSAQDLAQHTVQTVPSTQERWYPQQHRRKEETSYTPNPAQYSGPPHTTAPNHTTAQYITPRLAETIPQTPQQTVPRDLINYSTLQSTDVLNVPPPPYDSHHRPSRSHKPNRQERSDPPQQHRQDEILDTSTPADYPGPSHSTYSNDMAAQYLAPRSVVTVPPTPQQIVPRNLDDHDSSHFQPSDVNVPQPPADSQHRPSHSHQPNSKERRDSPQQRRQDEIPYASTLAQYSGPPHANRPDGMAVQNSSRSVESVPRILDSSGAASVIEDNNKPHQHDPHPPTSEPPAPRAQVSSDGHERRDQDNKTRPPPEPTRSNDATPPPQARDRDAQSTQRTLASNGSTFNSRSGTKPQPPRHLPKKLIMPSPLQHSLPMPSRDQSHLHPLQPGRQQQHLPSRPSSPPSSLHPSFNGLMPRAQNIPMSQGRKLRKQGSINGLPPSAVNGQQAVVSFPTNVGHSDPTPAPKTKVPRRLLSKRRSDL